jgi:hypothetical protein
MPIRPLSWVLSFVTRLRFPWLFLLTAVVFLLDLIIPDVLPFADEILLGLATALLGSWRERGNNTEESKEPE